MLLSTLLLFTYLITPNELLNAPNAWQILTEKPNHPIEQWTRHCTAKEYSNQALMHCYQQAYDKWDHELNQIYHQLRLQLDTAGQSKLRQTQRRWLAYRDSEFDLVKHLYGHLDGSMWSLIIAITKMDMVKQRALELDDYLTTLQFEKLSE
jgi:uncharacterized protein YecT (DUF1311 family)